MNPFSAPELALGYATSRPAVHPRIIERVRARLGRKFRRALDVGCGAGLSTAPLEPLAERRIGIDPEHAMLRWSGATAPGAWFVAARAEAIPLRAQSVDLITAAGSLNYADAGLFFSEAARVLAPGGVVVIYDFSQGRSFRGSTALDDWFAEFIGRYPPPRGEARHISPEVLASLDCGFRVEGHEDFETGLVLSPGFYLDYVMTETNVARAVRDGVPAAAIRAWCAGTLAPVFEGCNREVIFRGYIVYMVTL